MGKEEKSWGTAEQNTLWTRSSVRRNGEVQSREATRKAEERLGQKKQKQHVTEALGN